MNKFIKKILKYSLLLISLSVLVGCQSLNSRLGMDSSDYANAREMPPLKLPANALAVSNRYEIPEIPGNNNPVIFDNLPPDY